MRIFLILMMAGAMSAFATQTRAQEGDAQTRAALAERLIDAMVRESIDKVVDDVIGQMLSENSGAGDAQVAWTRATLPEMMGRHMEGLIDDMEGLYAERFTEQELRALVEFYETPMGRTIARKQNEVGAQQGLEMEAFMQAFMTEYIGKYCAEFGCGDGDPAAASLSKR